MDKKAWHAPELLSLEAKAITEQTLPLDAIPLDDTLPFGDWQQGPGVADQGS